MYCTKCGSQIADDAIECAYCGARTDDETNQYNHPVQQNTTQSQSNSIAVVGFIFAFIIPIVGLICSINGLRSAPRCNGKGKGLSIAGIIISSIIMLVIIIYVGIILSTLGIAIDDLLS